MFTPRNCAEVYDNSIPQFRNVLKEGDSGLLFERFAHVKITFEVQPRGCWKEQQRFQPGDIDLSFVPHSNDAACLLSS